MNRLKILLPLITILFAFHLQAQEKYTDAVYKDYLGTVQCFTGNSMLNYPILDLESGLLTLSLMIWKQM